MQSLESILSPNYTRRALFCFCGFTRRFTHPLSVVVFKKQLKPLEIRQDRHLVARLCTDARYVLKIIRTAQQGMLVGLLGPSQARRVS